MGLWACLEGIDGIGKTTVLTEIVNRQENFLWWDPEEEQGFVAHGKAVVFPDRRIDHIGHGAAVQHLVSRALVNNWAKIQRKVGFLLSDRSWLSNVAYAAAGCRQGFFEMETGLLVPDVYIVLLGAQKAAKGDDPDAETLARADGFYRDLFDTSPDRDKSLDFVRDYLFGWDRMVYAITVDGKSVEEVVSGVLEILDNEGFPVEDLW